MIAEKLDLAITDKSYYRAKTEAAVEDFGTYPYLTIAGQCAPEDEIFLGAIEKIYQLAYAIKFLQKADDLDFKVPKMECEWWVKGGPERQSDFISVAREEWCWRIMIRMPISVSDEVYKQGMAVAKEKGKQVADVQYEIIEQGKCVQCLHLGSYEEEGPTVDKILNLMKEEGLKHRGYHKEIYLSDPRKTAESKLKTIIRHPVM
ncbi:GyrI-like domain-containing protein [Reichenbachiella ulvae]|uniref:GyrI-like domain-containing protein n=1 Tax=Reichenbachiella ulvae TaxID=2980104 RepID=A0ABT3CX43_9BACT|nr:GyrI-like domain-containing protein [Reichenbachiella ulvae]MCV9388202.1 GyrI-like domain-containing protein [Reichenbachiella ulvae]